MNQYEIRLIDQKGKSRSLVIEANSEKEAITSESFKEQYQKGESIKDVVAISNLNNYSIIISDFRGRLSSVEVKAQSAKEAVKKIQGDLFFGSGKVIEVQKKMKGCVLK